MGKIVSLDTELEWLQISIEVELRWRMVVMTGLRDQSGFAQPMREGVT